MQKREKTGIIIKGCSPKLTNHIAECFNNGMTYAEITKKYYWLQDIIAHYNKTYV